MSQVLEVTVPDIGDFKGVTVIEVLVQVGQTIAKEQGIITLESDKATMEVPSPCAGMVKEIKVEIGDKVSQGTLLLLLDVEENGTQVQSTPTGVSAQAADIHTEVLVLGAGPGGYTAAFRAADLGKKVILVERYPRLGGVCLNVGCIPSKALLHVAQLIHETEEMGDCGVQFNKPQIAIDKVRNWKESIIKRLTAGLIALAKQRKVMVLTGLGQFTSPHTLSVNTTEGIKTIAFEHAIIAAGSQPTQIPNFPYHDKRLMDSTGALALSDIPERLLIIGGGIIGLEMATVYHALGSKITIAEFTDTLIPPADRDLVKPLQKRLEKHCEAIYLGTKVTALEDRPDALHAGFEGQKAPKEPVAFDRVLVSVGRRPNGQLIGADKAGVQVNAAGFITVDKQQRTNVAHIFAIGDIVGNPMLAHKAVYEGKIAAEVIAGHKVAFDARVIPNVAYTDPEIAWVGLTENEAKEKGIAYEKGAFPWIASGRALSVGRSEGITKLLFDSQTKRLIGAGIVGMNAGELIAEAGLAIEMDADVEDIALTIHAHPTLSETFHFAAEMAEGTITDLFAPRKQPWGG